jgi:hypothetical protein
MLKIVTTGTAAALFVCPFSLTPTALSSISAGTQKGAPIAVAKGDRLDIGVRGGACAQRARPHYDKARLYGGMRPAGEIRKVRVAIDRCSIAE